MERDVPATQRELANLMIETCDHPEYLVDHGLLDAVVSPDHLRQHLGDLATSLRAPVDRVDPLPISCW